jgi:hypothetical protein
MSWPLWVAVAIICWLAAALCLAIAFGRIIRAGT